MPFGIVDQTGPGMRQVVEFGDRSTGRGTFEGEFVARHCPQGPTGHTCATAPRRGPLAKLLWTDLLHITSCNMDHLNNIFNFVSLAYVSVKPLTSHQHITGHFGDKSFQAINCTGTDNQKLSSTILHTPETQKRNRKNCALPNKTIYTLIWYAFYDLQSENGVGPILTAREPSQGKVT